MNLFYFILFLIDKLNSIKLFFLNKISFLIKKKNILDIKKIIKTRKSCF